MYIGCHISSAGVKGIQKAIQHCVSMNGTALQIFVSNKIGKGTKKLTEIDIIEIKTLLNDTIKLIIHSPYTLNFANDFKEDYWGFNLILKELTIAHDINAVGCVIHMGKHLNNKNANTNFIKSIKFIVKQIRKEKLKSKIILETPAGQGTEMYTSVQEFCDMYNSFTENEKKHIGICIDTCHIYSCDYSVKEYFEQFNKLLSYNVISVIHFNDSKKEKGSRVDRHANINEGKIEENDLFFAVKIGKKYNIPIILETPDEDKHKNEIKLLKIG